jgi:hypothetical protein
MSDQAEREQRIADTVMAIMQFVDTTIHENARDQMDEIEMGLSAAGSIAVTVIMNMGPCPC